MRRRAIGGVLSVWLVGTLACGSTPATKTDADAAAVTRDGGDTAEAKDAVTDTAPESAPHEVGSDWPADALVDFVDESKDTSVAEVATDAASVETSADALSAEDFYVRFIGSQCAQKVRCSLMPSLEVCIESSYPYLRRQLQGDVIAGRVSVDATAAAQCLDATSKVSCNYSDRDAAEDAICNRVFVGTLTEGAPCANPYQCASGNCVSTCQPLDACCKGTCGPMRKIVGLGEACDPPARKCTPQALCSFLALPAQCVPRTPDGQPCTNSGTCLPGHICLLTTAAPPMGTCQRKPAHGAPCFDDGCDLDDDYCDPATKRCTQRPRPGAPCDPTELNDQCVRYAKCDVALKTCVELSRLNQPCSGRCIAGLNCGLMCTPPYVAPVCP